MHRFGLGQTPTRSPFRNCTAVQICTNCWHTWRPRGDVPFKCPKCRKTDSVEKLECAKHGKGRDAYFAAAGGRHE
jgi:hypothetical protein